MQRKAGKEERHAPYGFKEVPIEIWNTIAHMVQSGTGKFDRRSINSFARVCKFMEHVCEQDPRILVDAQAPCTSGYCLSAEDRESERVKGLHTDTKGKSKGYTGWKCNPQSRYLVKRGDVVRKCLSPPHPSLMAVLAPIKSMNDGWTRRWSIYHCNECAASTNSFVKSYSATRDRFMVNYEMAMPLHKTNNFNPSVTNFAAFTNAVPYYIGERALHNHTDARVMFRILRFSPSYYDEDTKNDFSGSEYLRDVTKYRLRFPSQAVRRSMRRKYEDAKVAFKRRPLAPRLSIPEGEALDRHFWSSNGVDPDCSDDQIIVIETPTCILQAMMQENRTGPLTDLWMGHIMQLISDVMTYELPMGGEYPTSKLKIALGYLISLVVDYEERDLMLNVVSNLANQHHTIISVRSWTVIPGGMNYSTASLSQRNSVGKTYRISNKNGRHSHVAIRVLFQESEIAPWIKGQGFYIENPVYNQLGNRTDY